MDTTQKITNRSVSYTHLDEQRFCAEQITDTFLQKRQNRWNNAGNDDAPKVGRGKILVFKKLLDRRFILLSLIHICE